jgi:hypothetical protein
VITGRCYCGAVLLKANARPECVTYCHCSDCWRLTGAPVAAFAGFAMGSVDVTPDPGRRTPRPDVARRFCPECGSALTAEFQYLPGQVYVPLGILNDADKLEPEGHAHFESRLCWLEINDDLPRSAESARERLQGRA